MLFGLFSCTLAFSTFPSLTSKCRHIIHYKKPLNNANGSSKDGLTEQIYETRTQNKFTKDSYTFTQTDDFVGRDGVIFYSTFLKFA